MTSSSKHLPQEKVFDDPLTLAHELAQSIADDLSGAVRQRGQASLVVSGGGTPRPMFEQLSRLSLPWSKVQVTLADERWVDTDHEASNEALVRRHLLVGEAVAAEMISLKNGAASPEQGESACEAALARIARPFDIVVLGMGGDGHTASLFPGTSALQKGLDPRCPQSCLAVHPKDAPHPRMSLTLAALLRSRRLIVHITGESKRALYRRALEPGPSDQYPIRSVLRGDHSKLQLYWSP